MSKDEETLREGTSTEAHVTSDSEKSKKRKSTIEEIEVDVNAPEPPSKRARRALKKGKKLPTKSANSGDEKDGEDTKEGGEKAKRSEHGVWIGNMPFTVTPAELKQWLIDNSGGVILDESITRIKMPTNKDKAKPRGTDDKPMNKGFAYVDFDGIGPQMAAIALSENLLGYRKLLIKSSTSFEGRPKPEKAEAAEADASTQAELAKNMNRKVFVGNLGFAINEDDLWSHFEKCGEIEWAKVATFQDTGKCKGYGWVKFKTPEAAGWAAKGFVKIKEEILTEEDFQEQEAEQSTGANEDAQKERKYKTRKWWVNKLKGRTLKIEMAEEDQVRYKKRFGKDAPPRSGQEGRGDFSRNAVSATDAVVA
ncbi:hypothetical protein jhhlp_006396 [Lomentospora prolificans]|uniref:RRM domain-containing protein n=1 Tax=Lomentospora prolificans TaxID=41688 RepID=A0A2N3N5T5_9PEZI|nr:hypothetical protein jhhlp_006396 [Lomentospora prolificans]